LISLLRSNGCEKISSASPRPMNCAIIDRPADV
jgi:hypothetical protein